MRRALLLCAGFVGCAFELERTANLGDGEITATAVRADGAVASNALVSVLGSARVTTARADGGFSLTGLVPGTWFLRITEDDDGDGAPERGAHVPVDIRRAGVTKNLSDGCGGAPKDVVTSVLLGDVVLADTGSVRGSVALVDGPLGASESARVVVWRDLVPGDGASAYALPIEAGAGVDANGDYRIDGVLPGNVHVAAFVFDDDAARPRLFAVGEAEVGAGDVTLDLVATETADTARGACAIDGDCQGVARCVEDTCVEPRLVGTQLEVQWTLPEPTAVDIVLASFTAPGGGADLREPDATPATVQDSARALVYDAPIGVIDLQLSTATQGAADGVLRGAVVVPGAAVLVPLELPLRADPCFVESGDEGVRDCDHDGLPGLPPPAGDDDPAWVACVQACQGAFGAAGAHAVCGAVDCDDDGDGQPDVTEPARCLGPGAGTDFDSDDLCEPAQDPSPLRADPPPSRY